MQKTKKTQLKIQNDAVSKHQLREALPELLRFLVNPEVNYRLTQTGFKVDYLAVTELIFDVFNYTPPAQVIVKNDNRSNN